MHRSRYERTTVFCEAVCVTQKNSENRGVADSCTAQADRVKNRLYVSLRGVVNKDAAEALVSAIFREVQKLSPGFDVVSDISQMKIGYPAASIYLRNAMDFLKARGVRRTVRVVGGSKSALTQFARATNAFNSKYKVYYVGTMAEAERKLKEPS